ncbi:MAG: hypothetical protein FIA98_01245 [Anaerolineae bacterium]|nr:hypothetical protein [Anaerolineae bacterium]
MGTCLAVVLCFACSAAPATQVLPTDTPIPLPSATFTPTIIWFPPTTTYTPFPTPVITPTADLRPKTGQVLLEDDFSDPAAWSLSRTDAGSVALGKNELTIAIAETNAYLYTLRDEPKFTDFYLEITAETSLCQKLDEYGVLFRLQSSGDYYRFALSCNGQVRLDRLINGQASSPQPWMLSGAVPPGAPATSRLGISAKGSAMSFFVNGEYQFSVQDPLLSSGSLGLFARSTNNMAVTVNFSDLLVYEVFEP